MKEIILNIEEVLCPRRHDKMEGFRITTNLFVYSLTISDGSHCCEDSGYFITEDDYEDLIGEELLGVRYFDGNIADDLSVERSIREHCPVHIDNCYFIDFATAKGPFQIAVYNEHNGFYGHDVNVVVGEYEDEFML